MDAKKKMKMKREFIKFLNKVPNLTDELREHAANCAINEIESSLDKHKKTVKLRP